MNESGKEKMNTPCLDRVNSPADLKALRSEELPALAADIRQTLIARVSENGGHLASNLGVVELTIALHRVFDAPGDHIIWDVGHQSYVHKLLTGRRDAFSTLREAGGLSGFEKRSESEYDCFGTGHSSTSISAALGFARSDALRGTDAYTVAVVGDGAFTGGMIHEALNNCEKNLRLIIIINENEMSISKNIGRFAQNLSVIRTKNGYFKAKRHAENLLSHIPLVGKGIYKRAVHVKKAMKNLMYGSNYFEDLGLYYLGPVDGNQEEDVEELLRVAKNMKTGVVVHVKTKKGKGYLPAEENPSRYHGMSPASCQTDEKTDFSSVFGRTLTEMAEQDTRICAITAAMADGTGLTDFRKSHPERFFDVGIAEEHAVTFAAGLAANGYLPVAAIYSTFLQRSYDNLIHDVALQNLPVTVAIDRAGLNARDGATHHGIFDVAFLSGIPGFHIYTPATYDTLRLCLRESLKNGVPAAIRYPGGGENPAVLKAFYSDRQPEKIGVRAAAVTGDVTHVIIVHGRMAGEALNAAETLRQSGIKAGVLLLEYLKPYARLAAEIIAILPKSTMALVFVEEEIRAGGMGMMLADVLHSYTADRNIKTAIVALDDSFAIPKAGETVWEAAKVSAPYIVKAARSL